MFPRHSKGHDVSPSYINYRANIMALKNEGCTHILATTAVGSLKEEVKMGDIVFVDQVFDRTVKRETTFYDGKQNSPKGVCHIPMHEPFCIETRKVIDCDYISFLSFLFHEVLPQVSQYSHLILTIVSVLITCVVALIIFLTKSQNHEIIADFMARVSKVDSYFLSFLHFNYCSKCKGI